MSLKEYKLAGLKDKFKPEIKTESVKPKSGAKVEKKRKSKK